MPVVLLGQQRHVGEGAAAGDVVLAALGPAHPLAVEARRVRGEVGLHADDRLDPRRPWPGGRSRRHRTRCRDRSSRWPACPSERPPRTAGRAWPPRRASSTRYGRAGGRTARRTGRSRLSIVPVGSDETQPEGGRVSHPRVQVEVDQRGWSRSLIRWAGGQLWPWRGASPTLPFRRRTPDTPIGPGDMNFGDIEKELIEQRATVEKIAGKGGELLEGKVGHASEIDKGRAGTDLVPRQARPGPRPR